MEKPTTAHQRAKYSRLSTTALEDKRIGGEPTKSPRQTYMRLPMARGELAGNVDAFSSQEGSMSILDKYTNRTNGKLNTPCPTRTDLIETPVKWTLGNLDKSDKYVISPLDSEKLDENPFI